MKRIGFLLLAVVLAVAFSAGGADAKQKKECSSKSRKHERSYKGSHGAGAGYFEHLIEKLELNDKQLASADKLKLAYKKETIKQEAEIKIAGVELQELLAFDTVNMNKVERKVKAIYDLKAELKIYRLQVMEELKQMLTVEQKRKLKSCESKSKGRRGKLSRD